MEQWEEDLEIDREIVHIYHRLWRYKRDTGWADFRKDCYSLIESAERIRNKSELMETTEDNKE
jgi:hypothetical protein